MYSKKSVAHGRERRSSTTGRQRTSRRAVKTRSRVCAPVAAPVIFGPVSGKLNKKAVIEAAFIRNRAVLDELAKH